MKNFELSVKETWHRIYVVPAESSDEAIATLKKAIDEGVEDDLFTSRDPEFLSTPVEDEDLIEVSRTP